MLQGVKMIIKPYVPVFVGDRLNYVHMWWCLSFRISIMVIAIQRFFLINTQDIKYK